MPGPPIAIMPATVLPALGAFFTTTEFDTKDSDEITIWMTYTVGAGLGVYMRMEAYDTVDRIWKLVTLQDPTITVIANVGFANEVDVAILQFPARSFSQIYSISVSPFSSVRLSFADVNAGASGTFGANVSFSTRRNNV